MIPVAPCRHERTRFVQHSGGDTDLHRCEHCGSRVWRERPAIAP